MISTVASTGIGLQISRFRADYALVPFGDLGLTHQFTISILFGTAKNTPDDHNLISPNDQRNELPSEPSHLN